MMKVLFSGGSGVISSACSALAAQRGMELYVLNRGRSSRPLPEGAHVLRGDIRDPASSREAKTHFEVGWRACRKQNIVDLRRR